MGIPRNHPAIARLLKLSSNSGATGILQTPSPLEKPEGNKEDKSPRKPARTAGKLNKTEEAFLQIALKEWKYVLFERIVIPINRRMRCEYTPDALCLSPNRKPRFVEVKGGFWRDDARVKTNIAGMLVGTAEMFQAVKKPEKKGGSWEIKPILGQAITTGSVLRGDRSFGINTHFNICSEKTGKPSVKTLKVWSSRTEICGDGSILLHTTPTLLAQAVRRLRTNTKKSERTKIDPRAFQAEELVGFLQETLPDLIRIILSPETTGKPISKKSGKA